MPAMSIKVGDRVWLRQGFDGKFAGAAIESGVVYKKAPGVVLKIESLTYLIGFTTQVNSQVWGIHESLQKDFKITDSRLTFGYWVTEKHIILCRKCR